MSIELTFELFEQISKDPEFDWERFEISKKDFASRSHFKGEEPDYDKVVHLNLASLTPADLLVLKDRIYEIDNKYLVRGTKSIITKYIAVQKGKVVRASGAKQMRFLMTNLIALHSERFWLKKTIQGQEYFFAVYGIDFNEEYRDRGTYYEASIDIDCYFTRKGDDHRKTFTFSNTQCRGMTALQLLTESGIGIATADDVVRHDDEFERYCHYATEVGLQMLSKGKATCGKNLGVNDQVAILVVDVADDNDEDDSNMYDCHKRHRYLPFTFYEIKNRKDDEAVVDLEAEDYYEEEKLYIEYPVHPTVKLFDLRRHKRFNVHINDLTEYVFDKNLHEKLVIDSEVKELIDLLSRNRDSSFQDVVAGKTGGTTVLLAGPPGVGKTLTAEIFSEAVEKPLYRVQCSQLGTDPDDLEDKLLEVFRRANRWQAIILLDESDVYVSKRGESLEKNAIVGVFLRVLEYQENTLFLTTNLPESVDDAIASRCIARIDYDIPKRQDLIKIWNVLSSNAGMKLDWIVTSQLVDAYPHLSGRDVKNILKLISARDQAIDLASVQQAAKFHPNRGSWAEREKSDVGTDSIKT